jgi:hypothetical protein
VTEIVIVIDKDIDLTMVLCCDVMCVTTIQ